MYNGFLLLLTLACPKSDTGEDSPPPPDEPDCPTLWVDHDGDGYGGSQFSYVSCDDLSGWVLRNDDCDDGDPATWPGAPEDCDGQDDDCDGMVDDGAPGLSTWYPDLDGDGWGAPAPEDRCAGGEGWSAQGEDCDDADARVHPAGTDDCAAHRDQDCDGQVACPWGDTVRLLGGSYNPWESTFAAGMGDVGGDGLTDVAVGFRLTDRENVLALYNGPHIAPRSWDTADATLTYTRMSQGPVPVGVGDLDRDGYSDVLVLVEDGSEVPACADWSQQGWLWHGPLEGTWDLDDADADIQCSAEAPQAPFGNARPAGDADGDGAPDIAFGSYNYDTYGMGDWYAWFLGGDLMWEHGLEEAFALLAERDGVNVEEGVAFGVGDLEGDGFDDVAFLGSRTWVYQGPLAGTLEVEAAVARSTGRAMSSGGDLDGDGRPDLVLLGSQVQVQAGPVTGDLDAVAPLATLLIGDSCLEGNRVVSSADLDGDGQVDLVYADPCDMEAGDYAGAAFVFWGPVTGTLTPRDDADAIVLGSDHYEQMGREVTSAGDTNGDGTDDVLLLSPGWFDGEEHIGSVLVLHGGQR